MSARKRTMGVLMDDRLWTVRDLARYSQQSISKIAHDVAAGRIQHVRLGAKSIRFRPTDIQAYLEAHAVQPGASS
jgi:predicted DNA-binding transcriptional regulator AlpA